MVGFFYTMKVFLFCEKKANTLLKCIEEDSSLSVLIQSK